MRLAARIDGQTTRFSIGRARQGFSTSNLAQGEDRAAWAVIGVDGLSRPRRFLSVETAFIDPMTANPVFYIGLRLAMKYSTGLEKD